MIRTVLTSTVALLVATLLTKAQDTPADALADPALDLKRPADRAKAVAKIKAIEDARAAKTRTKAKALGLAVRTEKPGGGVKEIVDFEGDRPIYIETKNLNAAISTAANLVQVSPYSLNGTGIIAGVWDGGSVRSTHQEFANGSRVTVLDGAAANNHATHVGGTIGAQGTSASAKGMATNVSIASYDWNSDTSEMTSRAATAANQFDTKIYLSNHSYGYSDGWDGNVWGGNGTDQNAADYSFGQYDGTARSLDSLMYSAPYYIAFWAAGNDGNDNPGTGSTVVIGGVSVAYNPAIHPAGDGVYRNGFETIGSHGIAKNLITIGAANDAVTSGTRDPAKSTLASFSSTGPTDDGRIKPDLVANGVGLTSTSSSGDTAYTGMSGTSMASPNATGSAVLVVDQYKRLFNSAMRASTLKGLLIHTATDIGNPGPDYKYGWGLVDTKKAVDLIRDHHAFPLKSRIIEDQVTTSATSRTYSFLWDGASPLRATACWTDPAASSTSSHDSRTARLVNNLNLKLIAPNGTEYFPYIMPFVGTWTVASMNQNATTGINNTDNVETVHVQSPGQIGTWQAVVSYTGSLTNNSQAYGLILSGTADSPNTVNVISPNGGEIFYRSSSYPITWSSNVVGNVSIELLKGGALHSVLSANEANDGSFAWLVPSSLPAASDYAIRISSVNNSSYTDTSAATFNIAVNPWESALDTTGIPWDSPGASPWFSQTTTTKDGADALQSGAIDHSGSSALDATISGPGTLTFWWKVSSESGYDFLKFDLNGVEQTGSLAKISGNVDWVQKTVAIPSGTTTLRWTYYKDDSVVAGSDAAWVDQVVYTPTAAPEIAVEQPVGTDLTDGSATINFGSVNTGSSSSAFTFTVRNTGTANLTGLSLSKSGTHSADYTLGSLGATTLAPGASTTFTATLSPSAAGTRAAAIQIASNDSNENPFDINLTGTGLGPATLAVSGSGGLTSSGTFGASFTPASIQYTLSNPGGNPLNWTAAKTAAWVDLSATSGTLAPGANTTVTVSINTAASSLNAGPYSDTVTFTNSTNGVGNTTRSVNLTVNPIAATVTLGNLLQIYDGSPKPVTVTTNPPGLAHSVTYNGSTTVPSEAGTYAVVATVTVPNHVGSATGNLVIAYGVSYDGNGNTTGTVPATQAKLRDEDLTLAVNSGNLTRAGFSFAGWNTSADGAGTDYPVGGTYSDNSNLTLFAKWTAGADGTWAQTSTGPFDWGTQANWTGNVLASGADRTASFTPNIIANQTVNLDTHRTIGNITFTDSTTSSHNLTISGTNILTLSRSSGVPIIDVTQSNRTLTISGQIAGTNGLRKNGAGNLIINNTSNDYSGGTIISAGILNLTGTSNTNLNGILGDATGGLTLDGGQLTVSSANISGSRVLTINPGGGSMLFNKNNNFTTTGKLTGSGTLTLKGASGSGTLPIFNFNSTSNDYSGALVLEANTANVNSFSDASGSGNIIFNRYDTNSNTFAYGASATSPLNLSNRSIEINAASSHTAILQNNNTTQPVSIHSHLLATGAGAKTLTLGAASGPSNVFAGNISDGTGGGTVAVTKAGAGTWALGGTNTYSGGTTVNAGGGRLVFQGLQALPANTTLTLTQNSSSSSAVSLLTDNAGTTTLNNTLNINHANAVLGINVYVGNNSTANGGTSSGTTTGSTIAFNKLIFSGLNNSQSLVGIGSVTSNNEYRLQLNSVELPAFNFTSLANWTARITGNSGAVTLGGTIQQLAGTSGFATNPILSLAGTSTGNQVTGNILDAADFPANSLARPLALTKIDAGTWTLSGINSYTGPTTISSGILEIGGGGTLGGGSYNGAISIASTSSGTLRFSSTASQILGGIISGAGAVVKNNSGTLTLTGPNTYTGTTTVSGGKLFINGNQSTASGAVSVATNATLGGIGTIGGNTTIAANGRLEFNISTLADSHDKLELAATRSLAFSGASVLTITSSGGNPAPGPYVLISAPGGITGSAPSTVNLPVGWAATVSIVDKGAEGKDLVLHVSSTGGPGPVAGFQLTGVPSQAVVGSTISGVTITARDASNQTATSFNGTVTFSGSAGVTGTSANFVNGVLSGVSVTPTAVGASQSITVTNGTGQTGSATLQVLSLFESWTVGDFGGSSLGNPAPGADPDGDGLTNLQEFAFGLNPTRNSLAPMVFTPGQPSFTPGIPALVNFATGNNPPDYRALFTRRKDHALAGITYAVLFSADLKAWTPGASGLVVESATTSDSNMEAVSVPFPGSVPLFGEGAGSASPKFFRVTVE